MNNGQTDRHTDREKNTLFLSIQIYQGREKSSLTVNKTKSTDAIYLKLPYVCKKEQVGNNQEKAQSEKDSHSKNRSQFNIN